MLRSVESLKGYNCVATDGEIGPVDDIYFGDDDWTVRYLVIRTGAWLFGRKVLLSPSSVAAVMHDEKALKMNLTKDQIENAPGIDSDRPVSRQQEVSLVNYYGWPAYWNGPYVWGPYTYPSALALAEPRPEELRAAEDERARREAAYDQNLRSFNEVNGYSVRGLEADIGDIEDLIFDDRSWEIRALVADTHKWWFGKNVLVPPSSVIDVEWDERKVKVNLTREQLQALPEISSVADLRETEPGVIDAQPGKGARS